MQRIGQVIGIKPEQLERYIQMHDECWPEIIAANPKVQEWWSYMIPMQQPVPERQPGEHWAKLRAVYHQD